jgi:putative ABC transport system ATP-binding protein
MSAPAGQAGLLELRGLKRSFQLGQTSVPALRGVSLSIGRGEMVAVWGPSGSGKSTLLNLLGLVDTPDAGSLQFDGDEISGLTDDALAARRNRKIGFVFQAFNLVPVFSALENVMLPLNILGVAPAEARVRASEWLERVGLAGFARHRPDRLSGGQRQRVAIARALVTAPKLVLADEPTANLDTANSTMVLDLLWEMSRAAQVTCVFATHDQRLMERAERHVLLRDGLIVEDTLAGVTA